MCLTGMILGGLGAAAAAKSMMKPPAQPAVPAVDPAAEQAKVDAAAASKANEKLAAKNRARKASSLLATGAIDAQAAPTSALGYGKSTLGA